MARKNKTVSFEFWQVTTPASYVGGFGAALSALAQITAFSSKNQIVGGYMMRWEELETTGRYFYGDFVKLRMDVLPLKGGTSTKSSSLNLPSNEGIAEPFIFLFDTQSDVLVVQHNHYGATLGSFVNYLQQLVAIGGGVSALPIFTPSAIQKLNQMNDVRRVSYRIARPTNAAYNPGSHGSIDSAVATMDDFNGESIEVSISSGFAKRSLTIREILYKAQSFLGGQSTGNAALKKFEIVGYANGSREEFDLVKDHLRVRIDVPVGAKRDLTYPSRKLAALQALNRCRSDLIALFGAKCA